MLLFSLIRASSMMVSYSSAPRMRSIPYGVLNVGSASLRIGRCFQDVVETVDEGRTLVSFDITKARSGMAVSFFGVRRKSAVLDYVAHLWRPDQRFAFDAFEAVDLVA